MGKKVSFRSGIGWTALLFLLSAAPARAITCDELNQLFRSKYSADFHVSWEIKPFGCPSTASAVASAMYELEHTTFTGVGAPNFYPWVTSIFTRSNYEDTLAGFPSYAAYSGNGVMTFLALFANQNLEYRTATLVHEARHNESDDPGHVNCTHGSMTDKPNACDAEFFGGDNKGGAYNYEFNFYWWVRDGSNQTDLSREQAGLLMRDYVLNRYNQISDADVHKFAP